MSDNEPRGIGVSGQFFETSIPETLRRNDAFITGTLLLESSRVFSLHAFSPRVAAGEIEGSRLTLEPPTTPKEHRFAFFFFAEAAPSGNNAATFGL